MRLYTVHELSGVAANGEGVEFVHEGFCWPAFFFALPWLLYRRLWLALLGYLLATVLLGILGTRAGLSENALLVCSLAFNFLFASEANDIRRWTLARAGYREIAVASGRSLIEAERDFFRRWPGPSIAPRAASLSPALPVPASPGTVWPRHPAEDHGVIGLFPKAGG